jgi:tetratricopeptide (TPR) repeat protein
VAASLNNLAALYYTQGCYVQAEPLYQRALAISEKALGPEHPDMAASLNNLAGLYKAQGRYVDAEPLYQRSLAIEAEPLYQRSLVIWEKALGSEHPDVATSLNNLATLSRAQGRYAQAEPLLRRSLAIWEKALGPEHPDVATTLNNLARLLQATNRLEEAEPLDAEGLSDSTQIHSINRAFTSESSRRLPQLLFSADGVIPQPRGDP